MKNLVSKIGSSIESFKKDVSLHVDNGNKAAGARARKASLELEKHMKDFRKKSVASSK